ncbi:MAG: phosphonate ABC transporter substrate-binding protein, partial [Proteobacteria bacterium]|nr:phosphonate ABC transporter substrate-binding protein [Pseudomonadota bacterium]
MMKQIAHAAIVATSVLLAGTAQADFKPLDADPTELNFGIISTESSSNLKAQWLPFLAAMEK